MKNKGFLITLIISLIIIGFLVHSYNQKTPLPKNTIALGSVSAINITQKETLPIDISVHEGHGHIVEGYNAKDKSNKVIIHIQDIHINYEAQKNMSKIIESLINEKGLKLIMVEGGWGDVSLTYLREHADKEQRLKVAEEYLLEGKIAGEEYLNIVSDYDMEIQGVEEESLYQKNLDAFFKIEEFREEGTEKIAQLKKITNALKEKIYHPDLLKLEKTQAEYDEEDISLSEFYKHLAVLAGTAQVDISAHKNFNNFINVAAMEKTINFAKVEKERTGLIEKLSKELPEEQIKLLVAKSLEFRLSKITPAKYHQYLQDVATKAGISFKRYEQLAKYTDYIATHEDINITLLFKEADSIEEDVKAALLGSEEQQELYNASKVFEIFDGFLNLKLIPDDFAYYKKHKGTFLVSKQKLFLAEKIKQYNMKIVLPTDVAVLDDNLSALVEFYDVATQRDEVFVKKAIALMKEKDQTIAVLIAGGYHTPNLTSMFKEKNISYIVVAPKTSQETDPEQYRYILQYKSGRTE